MTLCVMLVLAMRVSAAGVEAQPVVRRPRLRVVTVSGGAEEVRVAARTATRIRFDTSLDAERTRLEDGGLSGFLVRVRNPKPLRPWEPGDIRVRHAGAGEEVEVLASRMGPMSLSPGGWGWLVVITPALPGDGQARFELELRGRSGAFAAPPARVAL